MKTIGTLLLALALAPGLAAQSPEEIVAGCVEALGGKEAIEKWSDYRAKVEAKFLMYGRELNGNVEIIEKGIKKCSRTELAFGKETFVMASAYDGETAFNERQGEITDQPTLNYETERKHTIRALIDERATFTPTRETEIDGRKVTGVEADVGGAKTTFYIDKETHMPAEIVYEDIFFGDNQTKELLEKRIRYDEYRDFDGVRFPTRMTFYEKGEKKLEYHFVDVAFSPEVADDRFERPDQELDLRYWEEKMD